MAPLTKTILIDLGSVLNIHSFDSAVVWSIMTLARAGLFRLGELLPAYPDLPLPLNDIVVLSDCLIVTLRFQKNDPTGKGCQIRIPRTGDYTCAVSAFLYQKNLRLKFPPLSHSPFAFIWSNGTVVNKKVFISNFRALLKAKHYNAKQFAGHSFRRGGCQDLAREGASYADIMVAGRWKSASFMRYL